MTSNWPGRSQPTLFSQSIDLPEGQIFYQQNEWGPTDIPILLLHGWGISTTPYHEVLTLLAQRHAVIAPDLPSFARSAITQHIPDYEGYAQLLLAWLNELNLQQVHLVGHSLGGGIAITLAALRPDRVRSLVLVDSTGNPTVSLLEAVPRRALEMAAQLSWQQLYLQLVEIPRVFAHNLVFNFGNVIQGLLLSFQTDLKPLLPQVPAPTLLLWSEKDLITPLSAAQEMVALLPQAQLKTVPEGCHEWGLWHPAKFAAIILEFVQQVESELRVHRTIG